MIAPAVLIGVQRGSKLSLALLSHNADNFDLLVVTQISTAPPAFEVTAPSKSIMPTASRSIESPAAQLRNLRLKLTKIIHGD